MNIQRYKLILFALLFLGTCTIGIAQQTGPAGVGNSDGSSGKPRNVLWLDASSLSLTDGADVTSWADQSGNSLTFQPSASGSNTDGSDPGEPSYVSDGGALVNNLPVVRFDASNSERLILSSFSIMPTDEITTIIVMRRESTGADTNGEGIISYAVSGSSNEYLILNQSSGELETFVNGNNRGTGDLATGNFRVFSTRWERSSSQLIHNLDTDIEYNANNSSAVSITAGGTLALGGEQDGVDDDYATNQDFNGDIAEVIIYDESLGNSNRLIIENYLAHKYGITITDDFFGNSTDYDNSYEEDIRGIGSDGTNARTNSSNSDALTLREAFSTLDTDEYVMFAHSGTTHNDGVTSNRADIVNITDRWARDWYLEVNQGGGVAGVDGGDVSVEMAFDFGADAALNFSGSLSDYVLLYRSTATGDFDRVYADSYTLEGGDQVVVSVPSSRLNTGYYTLGTGNPLIAKTWYVFQDGDWDDPTTWTTDASTAPLFKNSLNEIPAAADEVIIRSGRTVTIQPGTDNLEVNQIKVNGTLDVTTTTGHDFNALNGNGVIRIAGNNPGSGLVDNFPAGNVTGNIGFADADNGGTVVINAAGDITLNEDRTFNNLRIELDNNTNGAILGADITLNGDFEVRNGGFQFGDGTNNNRTVTVFGDVLVVDNGSDKVGNISTANNNDGNRHQFNLYGDYTNWGVSLFTNRSDFASDTDRRDPAHSYYSNEATDGIVEVSFVSDDANQTVNCNNTTYFYRIVIDKGVDDTYVLSLEADSENDFRLLGPANDNVNSDQQTAAQNANAFALVNGTAEIRSNVEMPVLNRVSNYAISSTTRLWINGGDVRKTSSTAIVPYGIIQVSAGYLEATGNSGLTIRENGLVRVDGGQVVANQIRTSIAGPGSLGGYTQSGGEVTLDGSLGGNAHSNHYVFSLPYTGNIFIMSGGTLSVREPNSRGAIFINSDPANINVTGGTVVLESSNANDATITSRAPFYNVRMQASAASVGNVNLNGGTSGSGTGGERTLAAQTLIVKNDLIIHGYNDSYYENSLGNFPITFSAVNSDTTATDDSDAAVSDVYIGGSFYVGRNSAYQCLFGGAANYDADGDAPTHYNTTYFNQTTATSAVDTIYWGVTGSGIGQLEMGNFVLDRATGNELRTIARSGNSGGIRFDINGNVSVLSGTLDQNAYTFRIWGNITNQDRLGTYYSSGTYPVVDGTPSLAQIRFRESGTITITTTDDATFGNIRFNVGDGETVEFDSDVYIERMEYMNGRIYVKSNTLTVDEIWNINGGGGSYFDNDVANSSLIKVNNSGVVGNILVFTDGNASDGGLRLKVGGNTVAEDETSRVNNNGPITFPVGFTPDGGTTPISRPVQMKVKDFIDSGYVQINVVSGELQTSELSGGEILQHYWRVRHDDFTNLPTVAFRFYYRGSNTVNSGRDRPNLYASSSEDDYVPGYVLDGGTYDRYFESDPAEDKTDIFTSTAPNSGNQNANEDNRTRIITFNGNDTGGQFTQASFTGFELIEANFTAGLKARFEGAPEIYYSRRVSSNYNIGGMPQWSDGNTWSLTSHTGSAAGDWPQDGDIAIVGEGVSGGGSGGPRHHVAYRATDNYSLAKVEINNNLTIDSWDPRLFIEEGATVDLGVVDGNATLEVRVDPGSPSTITGDFGQFTSNDTSGARVLYKCEAGGTGVNAVELPQVTEEYPNVRVEGNGVREVYFPSEVTIRNELRIDSRAIFRPRHDIHVMGDLRLGNYLNGILEFPDDTEITVTVDGRLRLKSHNNSEVRVENDNTTSALSHRLIVGGDVELDQGNQLDLYNGIGANDDNCILEIRGEQNTSFLNDDNMPVELYQLVINKGTDQTYSFTVEDNGGNQAPNFGSGASSTFQPLEIVNGLLVTNDPDIDWTIANGSDFLLPNTANLAATSGSGGLEIQQGIARIDGDDTGIILDGLLRISGGELDMDDGANNGNNYIEYSSSSEAHLEVTSGNLTVGSQIRRSLTSTTGVLQYTQSGGDVVVGKNAAPEASRGLFEITNSGSSFEHAGGSLTIVRDNNSTTVPSLLLQPDTDNITAGTIITIGNGDTPASQDRFGIQSNTGLSEIEIASSDITAKLYNLPLTTDILAIGTGSVFNANGFNLTINEGLNNNGTFTTSGNSTNNQYTYFPISSAATITGSGTTNFWNFEKSGSGTLTTSKNITVDNNAFIYEGTLNTQTSAVNVKKDLLHDATHTSDAAGPGIVFNGNQQQNLDRSGTGTSQIGVIELDNASGLIIADTEENFQISGKLKLTTGVFDVGGNLIELSTEATIENGSGGTSVTDFNVNNMIQTNSAIKDFGIRKHFDAVSSGSESFTFPVGLVAYTPVVLDITDISASSITVRPVRDTPPITEDTENTGSCTDPNITDADNVLQYYWIIKSSGVSGFNGNMTMYYDASDTRVTAPYTIANYGLARLYNADSNWDKVFTTTDFDESNQRLIFPFVGNGDATLAGIYTAGVTLENDGTTLLCGAAIPDVVPTFTTNDGGGGTFFSDATYNGGIAPVAGETPDIIIESGDQLTFDQNSIRTRKITIESGGTLVIQNGTNNHNLGFVTGEGTIRLESNGISISFPTGDYEDFFPDASCSGGGGLEYAGTGSYAVLSDLPNIRRVIFSGSGNRTLPNNFTLNVCEDFDIRETTNLVIPDGNSTVVVRGNVYKSDGSTFDNGGGDSRITMGGSSSQIINGDFTGTNAFNKLEIDNATGFTVVNAADGLRSISANQDVEVASELVLTNGRITTDTNNSLRMLQGSNTSDASASSFVNGPLQAVLGDNDSFVFPTGKGSRFGQLSINDAIHPGEVLTWQVEYFSSNAEDDGEVTSLTATSDAAIQSISGNEYWVVTDDAGTAPSGSVSTAIGLRWDANSDAPADITTLSVMVWDGSEWDNYGGVSHSGNSSAGSFTNTTVSNTGSYIPFSEKVITMGSTESSVLPVEFIEFAADAQRFSVLLTWKTASETDNDFFEVQRSKDGKEWQAIGIVNGAGNSSEVRSYTYKDENPLVGTIYYRIRQVDFSGGFDYSKIASVEVDGYSSLNTSVLDIRVFPNPTKGAVTLQVEGLPYGVMTTVKILDIFGNALDTLELSTQSLVNGVKLNSQNRFSPGLYFIDIHQGNVNLQRKLIIQ